MVQVRLAFDHNSQSDSDISLAPVPEPVVPESNFDEKNNIVLSETPLMETLSGRYKHSFAYKTFRERVPKILEDLKVGMKEHEERIMQECGDYARFELKRVIWSLDILRQEVLENRKFKPFHDKEHDAHDWNKFIVYLVNRDKNHWFTAIFLHAECYLYRRIYAAFRREKSLRNYDYFSPQKMDATMRLCQVMHKVLMGTGPLVLGRESFRTMLKLSLWANRCDLSISNASPDERILELMFRYDKLLVTDESKDVWHLLTDGIHSSVSDSGIVDFVLDNAGFELFTDFVLGEYLLRTELAKKVRYHVKAFPWFISDVTANDFHWMLQFLSDHELPTLSSFGCRLKELISDGCLELCDTHPFWTRPQGFRSMRQMAPCLYVQLSFAALVIFKGDLNYRKLLDDINYNSTTPFVDCLGGFLPTSICALRAIKCDLYGGMPICVVEWLTKDDPNWMCTGERAVIQLAVKDRP